MYAHARNCVRTENACKDAGVHKAVRQNERNVTFNGTPSCIQRRYACERIMPKNAVSCALHASENP